MEDLHIKRLVKVYNATGGLEHKSVMLDAVLADEGLSEEDLWKEAYYQQGEHWIEVHGDNGPPYISITHAGVKEAQRHLTLTSFGSMTLEPPLSRTRQDPMRKKTLQEWAGGQQKLTVALVFTDIVGSTTLLKQVGNDDKWITLLMAHFECARRYIEKYNGCEIKLIGDSVMAAFHTTADAVRFAIDLYLNTGDARITIRAGIHVGQVKIIENDIYGRMIHVTSRVEHAEFGRMTAGPRIILSNSAREDVISEFGDNSSEVRFAAFEVDLRNFGPQKLWRVGTSAMIAADHKRRRASQPKEEPKSPPASNPPAEADPGLSRVSRLLKTDDLPGYKPQRPFVLPRRKPPGDKEEK